MRLNVGALIRAEPEAVVTPLQHDSCRGRECGHTDINADAAQATARRSTMGGTAIAVPNIAKVAGRGHGGAVSSSSDRWRSLSHAGTLTSCDR